MIERASAGTLILFAVGLLLAAAPWQRCDAQSRPVPFLITAPPDNRHLVRLVGNTRPEANVRNDRGRVPDSLRLEHIELLLRRPVERQRAFDRYLEALQDPRSPIFHQWLSPAQVAQRFGPAQHDIDVITAWLKRGGFEVTAVHRGALIIVFSGTAGQVWKAFHTQIHYLDVDGQRHIANMSDPEIPAALAPAIAGIVSLNDLRPYRMRLPRPKFRVH